MSTYYRFVIDLSRGVTMVYSYPHTRLSPPRDYPHSEIIPTPILSPQLAYSLSDVRADACARIIRLMSFGDRCQNTCVFHHTRVFVILRKCSIRYCSTCPPFGSGFMVITSEYPTIVGTNVYQ